MIEDVRAALEPFANHLEIAEEKNNIKVTVKDWLPDFNSVKEIVKGFGSKYHPYNKQTQEKAYWIIPKDVQPARMEGSTVNAVILALEGYAKEFEMQAKEANAHSESFRQMAEDLRRIKQ